MATRTLRALAVLGALAFVAASCGDDDDTTAQESTTVVSAEQTTTSASAPSDESTTTEAPATTAAPAKEPEKTAGFDGSEITVGIITPLTGAAALIGKPLAAGQEAYWDGINEEEGGVAGKYKVKYLIEDNEYKTDVTVQKYSKIKNDVVLISQIVGTANNLAVLPMLRDDNVVAAPASQDAFWVREQQLFPVIEPYQIDVINAFDYLWNEGGANGKTVCAVIQDDAYGEAGLQGLEFIAEKRGFPVKVVTRYKTTDQDFTAPVTALQKDGCEYVLATALPTQFAGILGKAAQLGFAPKWVAQSPAYIDEITAGPLKDYMEANVMVVAVGPELSYTGSPAAQLMSERQKKYTDLADPDYYFTFGYTQALALHQLLDKAVANGDLSREGIIKAMNEDLGEIDVQGLGGNYIYGPPEDRVPPTISSLFKVNTTKPFALEMIKENFTTEFAGDFEFVKADI
jgi:ABC-type branched-subunit amino acid transport system substrate-binding protein